MVRILLLIVGFLAVAGMLISCENLPSAKDKGAEETGLGEEGRGVPPGQGKPAVKKKPQAEPSPEPSERAEPSGKPAETSEPSVPSGTESQLVERAQQVLGQKAEEFVYNPINKADPFEPYSPVMAEKVVQAEMSQAELMSQYELRSLSLVAIAWGTVAPKAMFETPDGKAYSVKVGDIFSRDAARVLSISPDGVLVELASGRMATGEIAYQKLLIKLRSEEEEREISEAFLGFGKGSER